MDKFINKLSDLPSYIILKSDAGDMIIDMLNIYLEIMTQHFMNLNDKKTKINILDEDSIEEVGRKLSNYVLESLKNNEICRMC